MSRRVAAGLFLAGCCAVALVLAGALLSTALAPSPTADLLESQPNFTAEEHDRLGSDDDPIGYGGTPGPVTDLADLRVRYGAVQEPYWRTASYDTYTGTSWRATLGNDTYDDEQAPPPGETTRETRSIETWGAADLLPAPWRPVAVDDQTAANTKVRGDGSLVYGEYHSPGTTLTVTSEQPTWSYDALETAAAGDAPEVYTAVPDALPDRLVTKADEITADAETPYGTAVLIERWLLLEKAYAMDATAETEWLADEFVFERETGTSEFFATAMTTMLRTQDVPARYVTGFAPGEHTPAGEQVVRGEHAHAWVEVYFEDIGWVPFDPTPPDRIATRHGPTTTDSLPYGVGDATGATELVSVSDDTRTSNPGQLNNADDDEAVWETVVPTPAIEFSEDPVPGATVTIEVTRAGEPLTDHRVLLDGEPVGLTDANGQLDVEIPYRAEVSITIQRPVDGVPPDEGDQNGDDPEGQPDEGLGALQPETETGVGGDLDPSTFGNTDTELHFRVESSVPAYWRTGAYETFTGMGWEQEATTTPFEQPGDEPATPGPRLEYDVHLERPASALPTGWRPVTIDGIDGLQETSQGGIRTGEPVPAGTSFTGTSVMPTDDVDTLRAATGPDPSHIEATYTQLPATSDRVDTLAADLIGDEPTRYDAAMAVQSHLRSEKGYDLGASATGADIVDEFLFEMEAGYCEYFATSMVALLRAEDIPARYVVGYAPGDEIGDGVYEVRGIHAHAWVEVYFPDVGWVVFDPTPGDARQQSEQGAIEGEDPTADYSPPAQGSPGETFEPGGVSRDEGVIVDEDDFETGGYVDHVAVADEVDVGSTPDPLVDQVRFVVFPDDGQATPNAGTNSVGESPTTLDPLAGATDPIHTTTAALEHDDHQFVGVGPIVSLPAGDRLGAPGRSWANPTMIEADGTLNLSLETEIDLALGAASTPGEELSIAASIDGVPVPDATVEVTAADSGEILTVTRTDQDGLAVVTLPHHEQIEITVHREEATGSVEHAVDVGLALSLLGDPVPGGETTVHVTTDGDPAPAVPVTPGEVTTNESGYATIELPYTEQVTIEAAAGESQDATTLTFDPVLEIREDPVPGEAVTVAVRAAGQPIEGMPVTPGGNETDAEGVTTVTVPYMESFDLVAERGDIRLVDTVETDATLEVRQSGLPIPGTTTETTVRLDGEPLANATLTRDGEVLAETGPDGSASVPVPLDPTASPTITATKGELTAASTNGARLVWAVILGGTLAMVGTVVGLGRRRSQSEHGSLLQGLLARCVRIGSAIGRVGHGLREFLGAPLHTLLGWLGTVASDRGNAADAQQSPRDDAVPTQRDRGRETQAGTSGSVHDVEVAWEQFRTLTDADPSDTPSEVAQRAIENGFPREPVEQLTATYRVTRFGDGDDAAIPIDPESTLVQLAEAADP